MFSDAWRSLSARGIFIYYWGEIDANRSQMPGRCIYTGEPDDGKSAAQAAFQKLLDEGDPAAMEIVSEIIKARLLNTKP